jgi:SsrA-binding protein
MITYTTNKKANFEYIILEKFQAGLAISNGDMVKKIRNKEITPDHSFVIYQNNRLEAIGMGNNQQKLTIPLLLNKQEIKKILNYKKDKGITVIVLSFKAVNRYLKADIAVVKGKTKGDKRQTLKERDLERERQKNID